MNKKDLESLDIFPIKGYEDLTILGRKGTSDLSCLEEVLQQKCYRNTRYKFDVAEEEKWLDLGGNIGAFGLYVMSKGGFVNSYEPDGDCFEILMMNYANNFVDKQFKAYNTSVSHYEDKTLTFYRGGKDSDRYRTTLIPNKKNQVVLNNIYAGDIKHQIFDGIKMDIEGAEFGLIDNDLLPDSNKLVMEYHLTKDKSMINFHKRMDILRTKYDNVLYMPSLDRGYPNDTYPGFFDRIIICTNE